MSRQLWPAPHLAENPWAEAARNRAQQTTMGNHPRQPRLDARRADFARGSQSNESKVKARWDNGGFHMPGSYQK